jgi:hypothetical protein
MMTRYCPRSNKRGIRSPSQISWNPKRLGLMMELMILFNLSLQVRWSTIIKVKIENKASVLKKIRCKKIKLQVLAGLIMSYTRWYSKNLITWIGSQTSYKQISSFSTNSHKICSRLFRKFSQNRYLKQI